MSGLALWAWFGAIGYPKERIVRRIGYHRILDRLQACGWFASVREQKPLASADTP
jgi:hypothetical protein